MAVVGFHTYWWGHCKPCWFWLRIGFSCSKPLHFWCELDNWFEISLKTKSLVMWKPFMAPNERAWLLGMLNSWDWDWSPDCIRFSGTSLFSYINIITMKYILIKNISHISLLTWKKSHNHLLYVSYHWKINRIASQVVFFACSGLMPQNT